MFLLLFTIIVGNSSWVQAQGLSAPKDGVIVVKQQSLSTDKEVIINLSIDTAIDILEKTKLDRIKTGVLEFIWQNKKCSEKDLVVIGNLIKSSRNESVIMSAVLIYSRDANDVSLLTNIVLDKNAYDVTRWHSVMGVSAHKDAIKNLIKIVRSFIMSGDIIRNGSEVSFSSGREGDIASTAYENLMLLMETVRFGA